MPAAASPLNILLVDDQPGKLLSYEVMLEQLGETLVKASSGRAALEYLLKNEVAVILVDVSMPELDGFELAAMIRAHPRFAQTAMIFVSAIHLSELDRLRGYELGAVDYLPVPVVPELLRAKVRVFCDLYRKNRQLETLNAELERRVAERTEELADANAELEVRVEARTREREEALAQVAEMQKLESLGQLTGGLAHDFNNLLMVVLANLALARKRVEADERVAKWLDRARDAAESGATLTKRMLAFARRQVLKPESIELKPVISAMAEMLSHSLDPKIRIQLDLPDQLPPIRIDRNQFELALLNLGLNARDAMPDGGLLVLGAARASLEHLPEPLSEGDFVHFWVMDTGVGMDAQTVKRASEPFFTTKEAGKGSGLGLSMVHGLTLQSGGAMRILSEVGGGTTISLWLPTAPALEAVETPRAPAPIRVQKLRVLLVDDDPNVLSSTSDMLRELGHEPIDMALPSSALAFLKGGGEADVAIVDFAMPEMKGTRLASLIKQIVPDMPLLLATGYAGEKLDTQLARLDKPFSLADLARKLEEVASRSDDARAPRLAETRARAS